MSLKELKYVREHNLYYFLRPEKSRVSLLKLITFDSKNQFQQNKQIKLKLSICLIESVYLKLILHNKLLF